VGGGDDLADRGYRKAYLFADSDPDSHVENSWFLHAVREPNRTELTPTPTPTPKTHPKNQPNRTAPHRTAPHRTAPNQTVIFPYHYPQDLLPADFTSCQMNIKVDSNAAAEEVCRGAWTRVTVDRFWHMSHTL
jgi:hypothetical protein